MEHTVKGRTTSDRSRTHSGPTPNPDRTGPLSKRGPGGPVVQAVRLPVADTTWARATIGAMKTGAIAALAARSVRPSDRQVPALADDWASHEAERRAADLLNAAAHSAVAYLAAGTPNTATLDMLRLVAGLTGAMGGHGPVVSNNCAEAT